MRFWLVSLLCIALGACAGPQAVSERTRALLDDSLFSAPSELTGADRIFAASEEMRLYLAQPAMQRRMRGMGTGRGLLEALYDSGELRIEYDASITRNAAQAFTARVGNCLSLVVMTASFAKELGLRVRYQTAAVSGAVSRSDDLLVSSGHVNITLIPRATDRHDWSMTVDFVRPEELTRLRWREISEATVAAMFMNNRAVESLVAGRLDEAYAWARDAVLHDPGLLEAVNTLGLVYLRRGALTRAASAFDYVADRDPSNRNAIANLANAYERLGQVEEAGALRRRLAELEREPPLHYYSLGLAAMKRQDFSAARELFSRELARTHDYDELHYWLGRAYFELGDYEKALKHIDQATALSTALPRRQLYAAKTAWIRSRGVR